VSTDPRRPCIIGVGQATWRPDGSAEPLDALGLAPEPVRMWETVARRAAADAGAPALVADLDGVRVVYCQSWPYDDPPGRLSELLGAHPTHTRYTGIGGTTPLVELAAALAAIAAGDAEAVLLVSGEALATKRRLKKAGERPSWSHRHPDKQSMPFEAPFHDAEVAHEVFQAWLTFALWDVARRAHLGVAPRAYLGQLGQTMSALSQRAAGNPQAWFPAQIGASTLSRATAGNRMVGSPYTKHMVSVMDVDMAAAVIVTSTERAEALGVPADRRVHLAGYAYGCDPTYVAEHAPTFASPAMAAVFGSVLDQAGVAIGDVAHLDLYSCFASSVNFAADALDISPTDPRGLTVTGGLPYFGGPGSGYLTHAIASMVEVLRADRGALGLVSGVGMHMTKHVAGLLTTEPTSCPPVDLAVLQSSLRSTHPPRPIVHEHSGAATVVTYTVVHGRDGAPQWALLVCDVDGSREGARCYAKVLEGGLLAELSAPDVEAVGRRVILTTIDGPMGRMNVAA